MKKIITSYFTVLLSVFGYSIQAQETWTCYTDKQELLIDNQLLLGAFEYMDGSTWFVTNKGINIFKEGKWITHNKKTELLKNKIGAYMVDSQNRIWIGTGSPDMFFDGYALGQLYQGGVVIYDGDKWEAKNTKEMGIKSPVITTIYEASNGDIWMGVSSVTPGMEKQALFPKGALLRLSKETGEWTDYRQKEMPCIECHFVKGFYEDANGRMYFFAANGIYYFEDGKFVSVRKDNPDFKFPWGRWITARFTDSRGNLWLGAPARVARFDGKNWVSYNRKNGLPSMDNHPSGFFETQDGKIVMSTTNGLYTFNGSDQWEQDKIKYIFGNARLDEENRLWIPTHKGLIVRDGTEESLHKDLDKIYRFLEDQNGGVWALARGKGIHRYKDGSWQTFNKNNKLPSDRITMIYISENSTVWVGTNKGICKCEYE